MSTATQIAMDHNMTILYKWYWLSLILKNWTCMVLYDYSFSVCEQLPIF